MNLRRRTLIATAAFAPLAALLHPLAALGQPRGDFIELKPPLPVDAGGKIEVLELFAYGCIHCYNLEPALETWLKKLPADVQFRRVPAIFNRQMAHDASIFYTFEALGVLGKLHRPFFDAIHRDRLRTENSQALAEWLEKNGLDPKKFDDTLKSFGVQSKTKRAAQLTLAYKIDGTPAMAVHGRYTVSAGEGMFNTINALIDATRKQKP
jgi:protein dithiol oxidoreductase (disulfide-forming)